MREEAREVEKKNKKKIEQDRGEGFLLSFRTPATIIWSPAIDILLQQFTLHCVEKRRSIFELLSFTLRFKRKLWWVP
jgi:hypothetical protein